MQQLANSYRTPTASTLLPGSYLSYTTPAGLLPQPTADLHSYGSRALRLPPRSAQGFPIHPPPKPAQNSLKERARQTRSGFKGGGACGARGHLQSTQVTYFSTKAHPSIAFKKSGSTDLSPLRALRLGLVVLLDALSFGLVVLQQPRQTSKMLLQKSAGLARIPLQNEKWHHRAKASISEHPKPPTDLCGPVRPGPGGHKVGRQSTLHVPATEILSQTQGTSHRNRTLATVWCEAARDGLFGVARAWLCCFWPAGPAG